MSTSLHTAPSQEELAAAAFSAQAPVFDNLYTKDTIIQYKRRRVREQILRHLSPGSSLLELNSGTGEDALYFAQQGYHVHATDIAAGMQQVLRDKVAASDLQHLVSTEICSYTELHKLQNKGPYDALYSNFAGLNCTPDLDKVLYAFDSLLKPGGTATLVVLPGFCLWEFLLIARGKFRTATRRLFSGNGRKAHVEGVHFKCYYYNPSYITRRLQSQFEVVALEGLCTIAPPSYLEGFAEARPKLWRFLSRLEDRYAASWPWKLIGDYYILTLRKQ